MIFNLNQHWIRTRMKLQLQLTTRKFQATILEKIQALAVTRVLRIRALVTRLILETKLILGMRIDKL